MAADFQAVVVCGRNEQLKGQIAAANLYAGRRVRTLIDGDTGMSAGVITTEELDSMLPAEMEALSGRKLSLSADQISHLRRRTEPGLGFRLRRILGKANNLRVELVYNFLWSGVGLPTYDHRLAVMRTNAQASGNPCWASQVRNCSGVRIPSSMTAV